MKVYLAGPLFSQAERDWLSSIAARLRADAIECFVPHEAFAGTEPGSATAVFADDLPECVRVILCWRGLTGPW